MAAEYNEFHKNLKDYMKSTAGMLEDYFGNQLAVLKTDYHAKKLDSAVAEKTKKDFIAGMDQILEKKPPVAENITYDIIHKFKSLAESLDWSKPGAIDQLMRLYIKVKPPKKDEEINAKRAS